MLATKNTNILQQIIQWDKQQYLDFVASPEEVEYASRKEVIEALDAIHSIGVLPMESPFEYVKKIQSEFQYSRIAEKIPMVMRSFPLHLAFFIPIGPFLLKGSCQHSG